jgi:hypothetical protein
MMSGTPGTSSTPAGTRSNPRPRKPSASTAPKRPPVSGARSKTSARRSAATSASSLPTPLSPDELPSSPVGSTPPTGSSTSEPVGIRPISSAEDAASCVTTSPKEKRSNSTATRGGPSTTRWSPPDSLSVASSSPSTTRPRSRTRPTRSATETPPGPPTCSRFRSSRPLPPSPEPQAIYGTLIPAQLQTPQGLRAEIAENRFHAAARTEGLC